MLYIESFRWIETDADNQEGYYSFKIGVWEICIDCDESEIWRAYLCNKDQEVLEECKCDNQQEALGVANEFYSNLNALEQVYRRML